MQTKYLFYTISSAVIVAAAVLWFWKRNSRCDKTDIQRWLEEGKPSIEPDAENSEENELNAAPVQQQNQHKPALHFIDLENLSHRDADQAYKCLEQYCRSAVWANGDIAIIACNPNIRKHCEDLIGHTDSFKWLDSNSSANSADNLLILEARERDLEEYSEIYIGSGDSDLKPLLEEAEEHGLCSTIVYSNKSALSTEYIEADHIRCRHLWSN